MIGRLLLIMGILTFLSGLFGCGKKIDIGERGEDGIGKKARDNESGVTDLYYSYDGTIGGNNYHFRVTKEKDGRVVFRCEYLEHRDYDEMEREVAPDILDRLTAIYKECRLAEWDGFRKYNEYVMDGDGFSLSISFADGQNMSAHGSNAYPERYREFSEKLHGLLDPIAAEVLEEYRQKKIAAGIQGELTSVFATFIQHGGSGSDEYHITIYGSREHRDENVSIRVKSVSGEFLPAGEYQLYTGADKEALKFDAIQTVIEKYEVIRWCDYDRTAEDYNNSEWFQLAFGFDGGTTIAACGTEPPENYAEFRQEFLSLISSLVQELEAQKNE